MVAGVWDRMLEKYPDQAYQVYLVKGIRECFRIEFNYGSATCVSATTNMHLASEKPDVIDGFMTTELTACQILGPIDAAVAELIGLVPKGHNTGQWRLIVNLSHPA